MVLYSGEANCSVYEVGNKFIASRAAVVALSVAARDESIAIPNLCSSKSFSKSSSEESLSLSHSGIVQSIYDPSSKVSLCVIIPAVAI